MAMSRCRECGNQISTKAEACPKCGAKQAKPTGVLAWIGGGLFAIVVIMWISFSWESDEAQQKVVSKEAARSAALSPAQRADEGRRKVEAAVAKALADSKVTAAYGCRELVSKRLKDPESAKWESPWYTDAKISEAGARFGVQITGRSKNSFGAYTLSVFDCDLRMVGDRWQVMSIKENGK